MPRELPDDGVDRPGGGRLVRVLPAGTMQGVAVADHLDAAAAAGFDAVSLRPRDVDAWVAGAGDRALEQLAARVRALGLGVSEIDPVAGWCDPRLWPTPSLPAEVRRELDTAATLGAVAVTALVAPGEGWERGPGVEGLASLCAAAADRGVLVQVEPFGWSALGELGEAVAAVRATGATNAGVMVDTWHLQRRGGDVSTVDAVAVGEVLGLQLSDGPAAPVADDLRRDCVAARTWPGDPAGEMHPEQVLASLLRRGWSGPVAVEVFGDAGPDARARARRAAASLDAVLALVRG